MLTRALPSFLLAAVVIGTLIVWPFSAEGTPDQVTFVRDGEVIAQREVSALRNLSGRRVTRLIARMTEPRRTRRGRAELTFEADRVGVRRALARALASGGGTVVIDEKAVASRILLAVVKQRLRNNCETAALAMLLAARGKTVDQLTLQRRLARSGPLDPRAQPDGTMVWGDPDRGFVGRPDGGGVAGGFGVYEGPIRSLGKKYGVDLTSLSRTSPRRIYRALLQGNPVMAWIGLSDGPYETWETPAGRDITANFGEHTVVLAGARSGTVLVNDPLSGRRLRWSREDFELMWDRLGRRALLL